MTPIIQALNFKTGRDLVLINVLSILLILVIIFFPNSPVRMILGLTFVLFFVGYVSISALFPRKEELDSIERLAFSVGLSIAIIPLIGLILNYTSFGIRVYSVMFSLFLLILLVSITAVYRRSIHPGDAYTPLALYRDIRRFDVIQENSNKEVLYEVKSGKGFINIFTKIKLEYIALPLFIAISLFIYHQRYFSYIFMVIAAAIGSLLFIIFDRYFTKEEMDASFELPDDKSHTLRLIASILFFIFFGLSFLTLLQGFYTKTVWYYVFISLCAGVITTEILLVKTRTQGMINLTKSFLLVLNITLSNQILFPYGISLPDLGYHLHILFPIVNNGYVPHVSGYEYFPAHHILAAVNILICGSDPKMTYLYLGGFAICLGMLFVFLIGREFVNLKFGLFAALIYICLDYLIMYGLHPVHQAYNYSLSIMLFAVILYVYKKRDPRFIAFYPILVTTMVFAHHYSAMIILIVRSFVGILEAYKSAFAKGAESLITATAYDQLPIKTLFLNTLGSSILIILSVIGFLYFFKKRSFFNRAIMMTTITLAILLGIGVVLTVQWLLPDRIYPFLQLFGLVFLGSAGIMWISGNVNLKENRFKIVPVIVLIMCMSFFSLSSTIAGFETSLFVDEHTAYSKLYGSPQETYFGQWKASHIENKYLFGMDIGLEEELNRRRIGLSGELKKEFESRGFALPERPDVRTDKDYQWTIIDRKGNRPWYVVIKEKGGLNVYNITKITDRVPITRDGSIDVQNVSENSFVILNRFYLRTGFAIGIGGHLGQYEFIRIKDDEVYKLERYDRYYDNGMINLLYIS